VGNGPAIWDAAHKKMDRKCIMADAVHAYQPSVANELIVVPPLNVFFTHYEYSIRNKWRAPHCFHTAGLFAGTSVGPLGQFLGPLGRRENENWPFKSTFSFRRCSFHNLCSTHCNFLG